MDGAERFWGKPGMYLVSTYRESHLRNSFFKGPKMSENQYVDKKKRRQHNHKASPFDLQPLEWILNLEDSLHSLQHLKTEVRNFAFFCDLSTATTKYLRLWRPASAFKIHSKGCQSNGETLQLYRRLFFLSTYWFSDIFGPLKNYF